VYTRSNIIQLDLTETANQFLIRWIDPKNGNMFSNEERIAGGKKVEIKVPAEEAILWFTRL
jgi:hypothetical protein